MTDSDRPPAAPGPTSPHVLVWPEGRPDEAISPANGWRTALTIARLHLRNLLNPAKARRTRIASCKEGRPDAHLVEAALEDADAPRGDVLISTRSVI